MNDKAAPTTAAAPTGPARGGIDPAALAAASLAAAVSVLAPEGPYKPLGAVIGLTIAMLIFAYDIEPVRTGWQSLAFSMVVSLVLCLVFGYVVECIQAWIFVPTSSQTQVPDLSVALFWFCFSYVLWAVDRKRTRKTKAKIETAD